MENSINKVYPTLFEFPLKNVNHIVAFHFDWQYVVLLSSRWEDEGRNYDKRGTEVKRKLATPFLYSNTLITGSI